MSQANSLGRLPLIAVSILAIFLGASRDAANAAQEVSPQKEPPVPVEDPTLREALVFQFVPDYPVEGSLALIEGPVRVRVIIGKDGSVRPLEAVSGAPRLHLLALAAAGKWIFRPILLNGSPVEVETTIVVRFKFPEGVEDPTLREALVSQFVPDYPFEASLALIEGPVRVRVIIGKDGSVRPLEAVSGPPLLQPIALDAARKWIFRPILRNGSPVEVETIIVVRFKYPLGVEDPTLVREVAFQYVPEYPELAVRAKIEGPVRVRVIIRKDGSVRPLEVVTGHPLLHDLALDAARKWIFRPILRDGSPVEVETIIVVSFQAPSELTKRFPPPPPEPPISLSVDKDWLEAQKGAINSVDPALAADIRRLFEVTGAKDLVSYLFEVTLRSVRAQLLTTDSQVMPEQAVNVLVAKLREQFNSDQFLDLIAPIYAKHFTSANLKAVIAFYESPPGKLYLQRQRAFGSEVEDLAGNYLRRVLLPQAIKELAKEFPGPPKPRP